MRKQRLHDIILGMLLMALILGLAIPALAAVTTKALNANYMDIKLVVDGVPITPKDVNGNIVEPFAVDGTTYLPVRAVGEALGKEVTWDGNTNTVDLGVAPAGAIATEEKNWAGIASPTDLGVYIGDSTGGFYWATSKEMPNTFRAISMANAKVETAGARHGLRVSMEKGWQEEVSLCYYDGEFYGTSEIRIEKLISVLGDTTPVLTGLISLDGTNKVACGDGSYKIVLRGMLQDVISDPSDVNSIMELIEKADQLCAIRNDMSASEEEKEAATEEFKNLFSYADDKNVTTHEHIYQLNCVNVELKEGHWPHTWADLIIKNK